MSSEQNPGALALEEEQPGLQSDLEEVYKAYRHRHLQTQLDEIATAMEETLLQATIARRLFDAELTVDKDARETVAEAVTLLRDGDIEALDEMVDDLEETVEDEHGRITKAVNERRVETHEAVRALRKLNEQIEVMEQTKLDALESLFESWDWKAQVDYDDRDGFESRQEAARELGDDVSTILTEAREAVGAEFDDPTIRTVVDALLNEERIALDDIDPEELQALAESDLGGYIELSLGR